jgi:hypothetical protein
MNTEQLISKKVKHKFDQKLKQVLFDVINLEDHFDGLLIHTSDIIYLEEGELVNGYVKVGDVNFDSAVSKEFVETTADILEIEVTAETLNDNPKLVAEGIVVGETIIIDAVEPIEEIIPAKVVKKKSTKKQ